MSAQRYATCIAIVLALAVGLSAEAASIESAEVDGTAVPCDKNHYILDLPCATRAKLFYPITYQMADSALIAGSERHGWFDSLVVARVRGPDSILDLSWGEGGIASVPLWGESDNPVAIAVQPDGKILVLGVALVPTETELGYSRVQAHHGLSRLNADGSIDKSFNGSGRILFHIGVPNSTSARDDDSGNAIEVRPDGTIAVLNTYYRGQAGHDIARINADGTLDASFRAKPVREIGYAALIEYTNDRDQYFITADPREFTLLDRDVTFGWHRTGNIFPAHPPGIGAPDSVPVCRLYRKPAGESSGIHFFSADPAECAALASEAGGAWIVESAEAFRVELPDSETGSCAAGRASIFRLLAPGSTPAHRYTDEPSVRDAAIAGGWIAEGYGGNKVAMCGLAN